MLWSSRDAQVGPGEYVPDDRLPDEHPEHHPEPAAAAALAQRARVRVVRLADRHHLGDGFSGGLLPPSPVRASATKAAYDRERDR